MTTQYTETRLAPWRVNILAWQLIERSLDRELQADAGMPHAYYAILVALNEQRDRSLPLTRIASALDYSQSRMSHAVARLEESGWVQRLPDQTDRRVTLLKLTGDGRKALARASNGHLAEVQRVFYDHLDATDLADILRIGTKLLEGNAGELPHTILLRASREKLEA